MLWELGKRLAFGLDPELAHQLALDSLHHAGTSPAVLRRLRAWFGPRAAPAPVQAMGLTFAHPLGLAAGWDKEGRAGAGLFALGFSHVEFGTVTRVAQLGNPRPRVFRAEEAHALVNAMGFPNPGLDVMLENLAASAPYAGIVGVNVGKNKHTANEHAGDEVAALLRALEGHADYVTVNISSPNTPGLRSLSRATELERMLAPIVKARGELAMPMPLLLKLSPDDEDARLRDAAQIVVGMGLEGIVATNTTTCRTQLPARAAMWPGGASGRCLAGRSDEVLALLRAQLGAALVLVGVGGVDSSERLHAKLRAGATLVQAFTGFVYAGPRFVRELVG